MSDVAIKAIGAVVDGGDIAKAGKALAVSASAHTLSALSSEMSARRTISRGFVSADMASLAPGAPQGSTLYIPMMDGQKRELAWGPFLELSSYLGVGETLYPNDPIAAMGANLIGDLVTDPISYVPGLNFFSNKWGKLARFISAATKGGELAQSTGDVLRAAEAALKAAGAIVGDEKIAVRMLELARKGDKASQAEIKSLAKAIIAGGKLDNESAALMKALKSDPGAISKLMDLQKVMGEKALMPEKFFLGKGLADQVRRGQVNPILRVGMNPLFKPLAAWIRMPYRDSTFLTEVSTSVGGVVGTVFDKLLGKGRFMGGVADPVANRSAEIYGGIATAMKGAKASTQAQNIYNLKTMTSLLDVIVGAGSGSAHAAANIGREAADDVKEVARLMKDPIIGGTFTADEVGALVLAGRAGKNAARATATQAKEEMRFDKMLEDARSGAVAAGYDAKTADEHVAALRKAVHLFDTNEILFSAEELTHGIIARTSIANTMAESISHGMDDLLRTVLPGSEVTSVREALFVMLQNPEAFRVDKAGRIFLSGAKLKDGGARLERLFSEHPRLSALMKEGLPPDVGHVAEIIATSQRGTGELLFDRGFIENFVRNYASRQVDLTLRTRLSKDQMHAKINEILDPVFKSDDFIAGVLKRNPLRGREGRVSATHLREATDDLLFKLEDTGVWRVRRDGIHQWASYTTAANKTLTLNGVWTDMISRSPAAMREWFPDGTNLSRGVPRAMLHPEEFKRLPAHLKKFYMELDGAPRTVQKAKGEVLESLAEMGPKMVNTGNARKLVSSRILKEAAVGKKLTKLRRVAGDSKVVVSGRGSNQKTRAITHAEMAEWIETGKVPAGVITSRSGLLQRIRKAEASAQKEMAKSLGKKPLKAKAAEVAPVKDFRPKMYVHNEIYPHIQEAFYISPTEQFGPRWLRALHEGLRHTKAGMLVADFFHYNVLAYAQTAGLPKEFLAEMVTSGGAGLKTQALAGTVAGTAVSLVNDEPEAVLMGGLTGALWARTLRAAKTNATLARKSMLNPGRAVTLARMARGGATGRPNYHAIGIVEGFLRNVSEKAAAGAYGGLVPAGWVESAAHGQGWFEREMWANLHQGTKVMYFDVMFDRYWSEWEKAGKLVGKTASELTAMEAKLSRELVMAANLNTGGLRMSLMMKDPTIARHLPLVQLAPDYTISRLGHFGAIFTNMSAVQSGFAGAAIGAAAELAESGYDADHMTWNGVWRGGALGLVMGRWMKGVNRRMMVPGDTLRKEALRIYRNAVTGVFVMSNLLNYSFTGRWLHQNPEGYRLSIGLGRDEGGRDIYVGIGKPHKEALEVAGILDREKYGFAPVNRLYAKGPPLIKTAFTLASSGSSFNQPIINPEGSMWEMGTQLVSYLGSQFSPIAAGGVLQAGESLIEGKAQPSDAGIVALRTAGFATKKSKALVDMERLRSLTGYQPD